MRASLTRSPETHCLVLSHLITMMPQSIPMLTLKVPINRRMSRSLMREVRSSWRMDLFMLASGTLSRRKGKGRGYGKMVRYMKGGGKMIKLTEKEG